LEILPVLRGIIILFRMRESSVRVAFVYGLLKGGAFGAALSICALWNGVLERYPAWKVAVGFSAFTLVCAVSAGAVAVATHAADNSAEDKSGPE
jgi:hypothetical protein